MADGGRPEENRAIFCHSWVFKIFCGVWTKFPISPLCRMMFALQLWQIHITTRLTYNCAHLRSTKESLTDSVKNLFVEKNFCVKIFFGWKFLVKFLWVIFFWVNIFLSEIFGWKFFGWKIFFLKFFFLNFFFF